MLRVVSDALTAADAGQVTLITLLDLTAAFDCVDHALLLRRLQYNFGFNDDVLRIDDVVRYRPDATGLLRRSAVAHQSSAVRSTAGVRSCSPAVCAARSLRSGRRKPPPLS